MKEVSKLLWLINPRTQIQYKNLIWSHQLRTKLWKLSERDTLKTKLAGFRSNPHTFFFFRITRQTVSQVLASPQDPAGVHDHDSAQCPRQQSHLCWQAAGAHGQVAGHWWCAQLDESDTIQGLYQLIIYVTCGKVAHVSCKDVSANKANIAKIFWNMYFYIFYIE